VNTTTEVIGSSVGRGAARAEAATSNVVVRQLLLVSQLALALAVAYVYSIEGATFLRVFALASAGFAINLVLPAALRLRFFVLLSLGGAFLIFKPADAAWLIASGLTLIGLCHLPVAFRVRIAIVVSVALLLLVSRAGVIGAPFSAAVWPILGSMFMFRLVIYMMDIRKPQAGRSLWDALAYFFMLPNLAFPLFPVVDFTTFKRTYYDREDLKIYEQGLLWITRGIVHLALYRFVYHTVLNDPTDVIALSDLVRYMLGTFLLYLRVSGQFHLIVGLLHLFGFRLPETHKLYYLASSFTELWRRINIYWTDFMMKSVFYPTYFKVKHLGPSRALVLSTTAVFVTTWILHSYQWFWLRGGFPMTAQDVLFWGVLGVFVVTGALKEAKAVKKLKPRVTGWNWRLGVKAATTFACFCFLWSLWSAESVTQWVWMMGAAANVDALGLILAALALGTILLLGGRDWEAARSNPSPAAWLRVATHPALRVVTPLVVLLALAQPSFQAAMPETVSAGVAAMRSTGLNAHDAAAQHRGYYEQLDVRDQLSGDVANVLNRNGEHWDDPASVGIIRKRSDLLERDLYPSKHVLWNGNVFTTNADGMRDQAYAKAKAPGTLRIALLGPSHVMGNGVADGQTFEALVEDRLNREFKHPKYTRFEILNFGVDGYCTPQQLALLQDRVFAFSPDIVIATHYHRNREMVESYLAKMVWGGIDVPYEPVRDLLRTAGVSTVDRGTVPVPFATGRAVAKYFGVDVRMPAGEADARIRRIADRVLDWSFAAFAETTRAHGARPALLALNVVLDDVPPRMSNDAAIRQTGMPVIDLFSIFPPEARPSLRVAPWDDHPNVKGHQLIADRFYGELVRLLDGGALDPSVATRAALHTSDGGPTR
jgi:D-alanyl-lipoteichoic acid acyltransferase DltB (MBOAT superfamily)